MTIRTALIGLGMMGRNHARIMSNLPGTELVALADPQGDVHGVAGGRPVYETVEQLFDHGIDAAVCAVPTRFHFETATKLGEAGIHVMVEKPIANTVEEGEKLTELFESKNLIGAVGHVERFNAALREMRRRIDEGQLGEVYQVSTRREGPFPARIADVGVVKDLATHDIDLTQWVTGSKFAEISAQTTKKAGRQYEDMVVAVGRLESGVITTHTVNWLSPFKVRQTVVTGERGAFVADTLTADLTFYENGSVPTDWASVSNFRGVTEGEIVRYAFPKKEPLLVEHEAFRDAILGKSQEQVTMRQGLTALSVAEQMLA